MIVLSLFGFPLHFMQHGQIFQYIFPLATQSREYPQRHCRTGSPFPIEDFRLSMTSVISTTHHLLSLYNKSLCCFMFTFFVRVLAPNNAYRLWQTCHILRLCARGFGYVSESDFPMNGSYRWIAKSWPKFSFPTYLWNIY